MKKLLLILLCLPMIGFGQNVYIPDANFKAYLVGNTAINTNGDAEIQISEANSFSGTIVCSNLNISDLTGFEAFTVLTYLNCEGNQLSILDVSQNTALTYLNCEDNQLTNLDLSNNIALIESKCQGNQLTILDVSQNSALISLNCRTNQLTSLDVSQNSALTSLNCRSNQLTSLDISQNSALTFLNCSTNVFTSLDLRNGNNTNLSFYNLNNPNLYCINVDDAAWSSTNWTATNYSIDAQHYFSNNCSTTDIEEHSISKELLKVTDLLGKETKQTNQPLFYIYDDGTVEKRIVVE